MTSDQLTDYTQRAGVRPMPLGWVEPAVPFLHTPELAADLAAAGQTYWADFSIYQPVITSAYPYPVCGFRADSGGAVDGHAAQNWAYCQDPDRMPVTIAYLVFRPGQRTALMSRVRNLFGKTCPPNLVLEIDMESGTGFAGPGNHSTEANALAADLAAYADSQDRVQGYANTPDWAACWPTPPGWMKRRLARYSATAWPVPAGFYAVQYYGGLPYPSPSGFPRACAPFGAYVDMNVTPRTISQMLTDYAIGDTVPSLDDEDVAKIWAYPIRSQDQKQLHAAAYWLENPNEDLAALTKQVSTLTTAVANLTDLVEALTPGGTVPTGPVSGTVSGTLTITPQE